MGDIRIIVADDEPLQRQALVMILDGTPGFRVIAQAADGKEAVAAYIDHKPDIILMDLLMPRMTGLEATTRLMSLDNTARILVLTSLATEQQLLPALNAGACGYLTKDISAEALIESIRGAIDGDMKLSNTVTRSLVQMVLQNSKAEAQATNNHPNPLARDQTGKIATQYCPPEATAREQSILELLARGQSNAEIGQQLYLSEATVKANLARIMTKFDTQNRVQTLITAVRMGLVTLDE